MYIARYVWDAIEGIIWGALYIDESIAEEVMKLHQRET